MRRRSLSPSLSCVVALLAPAWAGAADLGAREWPAGSHRDCVVVASLQTPAAREFHAAFARHWCQQGWAANTDLLLRETAPERWVTRVDILRNEDLMLSVPMSPYVEQNLEHVSAAVVARIAGTLLQQDANGGSGTGLLPAANQPGSERK